MKHMKRRAAALILALAMLLGLAACGKDGKQGGEDQLLSSTVYVPQFLDMNIEGIEDISGGCVGEDWVYLIANKGEETTETDPVTGETYPGYVYNTYRLPLAGGEAEKLENYQMTALPEGTEGGVYIEKVTAGEDNTLWVTEVINAYTFDLPEDFDENTDDRWSYEVDQNTVLRRQLDAAGNEITRTELDASALNEKLEAEYTSGMNYDREGNIYVTSEKKLFVLDKDQNLLFSLDGEQLYGELVLLGDGTMALLHNYHDEEKETSRNIMKTIDLAGKAWGPEYVMPVNAYSAFTGGGDYLFYYQNNDSIYGCKAGSQDGEKLFSWIDSDINRSDVSFFEFTPDGRVVVVTREELVPEVARLCQSFQLTKVSKVIRGGENRTQSARLGTLEARQDTPLIAIHDGARPFVPVQVIEDAVAQAAKNGAAAPAVPVKDTIKIAENGIVTQTPDRASLYAVQTPQVFDASLIRAALQKALDDGAAVTDDCAAVERLGMKVVLTPGDERNIKLTTPIDLEVGELLAAEGAGML